MGNYCSPNKLGALRTYEEFRHDDWVLFYIFDTLMRNFCHIFQVRILESPKLMLCSHVHFLHGRNLMDDVLIIECGMLWWWTTRFKVKKALIWSSQTLNCLINKVDEKSLIILLFWGDVPFILLTLFLSGKKWPG